MDALEEKKLTLSRIDSKKEQIVIIGTGTNALFAYRTIEKYKLYSVLGFAVNREYKKEDTFCGLPVYELEDLHRRFDVADVKVFVALLWNRLNSDRRNLYEQAKEKGFRCGNIFSPLAAIHIDTCQLENVWIHDFAIIQPGVVLGNNVAIMGGSIVGCDSVIESHCFLGAKSTVAGGCHVGEQTFVGINCVVFDDTRVGKKCILGACTAVKRNVPDFTLWKTSSMEIQIKQYTEKEIENKLLFRLNKR